MRQSIILKNYFGVMSSHGFNTTHWSTTQSPNTVVWHFSLQVLGSFPILSPIDGFLPPSNMYQFQRNISPLRTMLISMLQAFHPSSNITLSHESNSPYTYTTPGYYNPSIYFNQQFLLHFPMYTKNNFFPILIYRTFSTRQLLHSTF